jgi:hypothetical protein
MTKKQYVAMRATQRKFIDNLMAREEAESKARREAQRARPKPEQTKAA